MPENSRRSHLPVPSLRSPPPACRVQNFSALGSSGSRVCDPAGPVPTERRSLLLLIVDTSFLGYLSITVYVDVPLYKTLCFTLVL